MRIATLRRLEQVGALCSVPLFLVVACEPVSLTIADKSDAGASQAGEDGCGSDDCGQTGGAPAATGGAAGMVGGSGSSSGGSGASAGEPAGGGASGTSSTGGTSTGGTSTGGTSTGGTNTGGTNTGGTNTGGTSTGGTNTGGTGGVLPPDPYAPRNGTFKMLVYTKTIAYRHASIEAGVTMLEAISRERDFTVVVTASNEHFTAEGLSQFEIVFFMQTTGDVLNSDEELAIETWMVERHGAWAGVHAAVDAEFDWPFYLELIGQGGVTHSPQGTTGLLDFAPEYAAHPAVAGLPNPWERVEEWKNFDQHETWSKKPGFRILARKRSDNQPMVWDREYGNYRAFFTALGHDQTVFSERAMKQHLTGGILWAVRREHLLR
ncbi:MAG TPA: ThuA domain-containing protein [Polyangiaceae bacterium]